MTVKGKNPERSNGAAPFNLEPIVISGLSGRFPESSNVEEFAENLFGGVDMITEDGRRWTPGIYGLPTRSGKLKELDKFDADFFSVHAKQADFMDPQLRLLLEVTHEAIIDAGVNPQEIQGQNVGVFIGASASESEFQWVNDTTIKHGYALTGCQRAMFSNRISYAFDFKGPSFTLDTACSSSLMALDQACAALKLGQCDSAIVGGVHLCLNPKSTLQFHKLNMLSPQGKCRSFDASGDGYVRSEAIVAVFLQRKNVARRFYASILAVKTNTDGHKTEGVAFPSGEMQKILLQETYKEAGIDPNDVVYVEAHGTGTPAGDPQELNAIAEVFCKDRNPENPLLIGSVKSNMGHSEPSSGLCGVAKVLLAIQRGIIPGNLHYNSPNPNIPALKSGQLKVVSENTPWKGGIVGINSFGFGGANVHVIFQSSPKQISEEQDQVSMEIPYIVPFSGRTKDSVESALKKTSSIKICNHEIGLLHQIHSKNIPGNNFRGFAVVPENPQETEIGVGPIKPQSETSQVWFIFNGMGSQWAGMGKSLMKFQACKESLEKSAAILKTKNFDLLDVLMNHPEASFENILYSSTCVSAVQIALVDLLVSLNIKPDGTIGYSLGELGAAYADNCLTAEQVILTVYAGCEAVLDIKDGTGDGAMAAVGMSWEEAMTKCPNGIYPSCHNSKDSVTVSGPVELINNFVQQLSKEGIFARKINSSNQAFHSKYVEPARLKVKESLDKIIPVPVPRSSRWISSSIPESEWDSDLAKTSSADYHMNNWVSPVLFKEAVEKIPASSVVIEIGPHGVLQPILKQSLPHCSHIGLLSKNHKDNSIFLCNSIGKMFNFGLNPLLSNLYPEVHFPVPLNTQSLSSVVSKCWDHSKSWNVPSFSSASSNSNSIKNGSGGFNFEISLDNKEDVFYSEHKIDGQILFPQSGLIVLAWKSLAKIHQWPFEKLAFVIENLVVAKPAMILKKGEGSLKFCVSIIQSTGEFRIEESKLLVAAGTIRPLLSGDFIPLDPISILMHQETQEMVLNQQDFYKYMRLRGHDYAGAFQGVKRVSLDGGWAEVKFSNWVAFLDTLLHPLLGYHGETKSVFHSTGLKKLAIDPQTFFDSLNTSTSTENSESRPPMIPAFCYPKIELLSCAGVQIQGQRFEAVSRNTQQIALPQLEKFEFTPYFDEPVDKTFDHCLHASVGLVLENILKDDLKVLELAKSLKDVIATFVKNFCESQPKRTCDAVVAVSNFENCDTEQKLIQDSGIALHLLDSSGESLKIVKERSQDKNLLIIHDLKIITKIAQDVAIGTFVLLRLPSSDQSRIETQVLEQAHLINVSQTISKEFSFFLYRKVGKNQLAHNPPAPSTITIDFCKNSIDDLEYNYNWVDNLKAEMGQATTDKIEQGFRINVISNAFNSGKFIPSGVTGLINSLRREPGGQALRCFFINDLDSPVFDFQCPDQELETIIQRDLLMNVYQNGVWGSYRFFHLEPQNSKQVENAYLNVLKHGDSTSFQWLESPLKYSKEDLCSVYYSSLNFRDVMPASGKLNPGSLPNNLGNQDCIFGMEFSGVDSQGKRVMGILPAKAMATSVIPDPGFLWEVPLNWSLADAATVPVAYSTAYYALCVRGGLHEGESVLIHGGAGAVGLAAISIALSKNCRVFTTVSLIEKREFLKTTFLQLTESSFANSRDTSFLQHIMKETNGHGVDVVLNSLAGDKLMASIECTAQHGRFLELGKVDLDTKLGMSLFLKNATFHGIVLDSLTSSNMEQNKVWKLFQNGIETGVVKPLNYTVFSDSVDDIEQAFRFMASGKHIGKILIQIRKEDEKPVDKIVQALPRTYFDPSKSYIILGGLGGFGLELCDWMIQRGASKLMLISRSGVTTGYQKLCLNRWMKSGVVSVVTSTADATTLEGATQILNKAIDYFDGAPIGGIFNLAMVLRDGLFENQTLENFEAVAKPKINATIAMDKASRTLAPELEYFVCFSSIVSGRGAPGVSNYACANSGLERICENRKMEGLPALTIQWGAIGDVGVMVDKFKLSEDESIEGIVSQNIASCLNTLDLFLQSSLSSEEEGCSTFSSFVLASKTKSEEVLSQTDLVESIARVLGLTVQELEKNPQKPFHEFGMDSLMMAEIQQAMEVILGHTKNVVDLQTLSLNKLLESMPNVTRNQNLESQKEAQEMAEMRDFETSCRTTDNDFQKHLPVNFQQENPKDKKSSLTEAQIKLANSTSRFEGLQKYMAYFSSMLILSIVYLILLPISSVIRVCAKTSIWIFHDSSKIKLMEGIGESSFITDNAVSVNIMKFSGVPNREEVVNRLQKRLFSFQSNTRLDSSISCEPTATEKFAEPFERLKWSIERGFWFCYWKKDPNFNASRHVVFKEIVTSDLDNEIPRLAKYYHNLKWNEHVGSSCRPWWEFQIVNSPKSKEFLMVLGCNHVYGDGPSLVRLFQQLFMDSTPIILKQDVDKAGSTADTPPVTKPLQFNMFEEMNHVIAETRHLLYSAHLLIAMFADTLLNTWDTRKSTFFSKAEHHAASAFRKFPLSRLKFVKNPETGRLFNLNAVLLTVSARVCRRIVKESKTSGHKVPTELLPAVTFMPSHDSQCSLVNEMVIFPIKVPLDFDFEVEHDGPGDEDIKSMLATLKTTESNLTTIGDTKKLLVIQKFLATTSTFPLPLLTLGNMAKSSFVFSNILAIMPKASTLVNGYQLKDIYGFAKPFPFSLIAITDSLNDSLTMTLTIGDTILNTISPEFHRLFFSYFEQEMKKLQKCVAK